MCGTQGSLTERGHPAGYSVWDRGYFNKATAAAFTRPATAIGYRLVGDYDGNRNRGNLGVQGTAHGAILVEGDWYCPSMPQDLIAATMTYREDRDRKTYAKRIRQRGKYLFRRKDGNAFHRPATGPGATAACPLEPTGPVALGIPTHREFTVVLDPPTEPPKCCANKSSVTLPTDVGEKFRQSLRYGTPQWNAFYGPLRSIMEGFNGYAKDAKHQDLGEPSHRRVRGFFANGLIAALTLAATNVRKIHAFVADDRPLPIEPQAPRWFDDPPDQKRLPAAS